MSAAQDDNLSDFISPFLKSRGITEETILVTPKEPSRNKKVYVIKKETGLTGRNYVHCSSCNFSSFKMYRSVTRAFAPDHLKHFGNNSDSELLRFCRSCWYGMTSSNSKTASGSKRYGVPERPRVSNYEVNRPYFERDPLGITDQRACFSWHFIQRDFIRRKVGKNGTIHEQNNIMLPLVSVIGQDGSQFLERGYMANRFDLNGREISSLDESGYGSKTTSPRNDDEMDSVSSILLNIQRDHNYAPVMQREVEIKTSAVSPGQHSYQNIYGTRVNEKNSCKQSQCSGRQATSKPMKKTGGVFDCRQQQQTATKTIKTGGLLDCRQQQQQPSSNFLTVNLPVSKVEEQLQSKREKGEEPDPSHLMGLKATAEDGQTMPGLICPLCGKHTVKSYSVWRKENAPPKIRHLFRDGVTVIRACRKCVPYPLQREKKKADRNCSSGNLPPKVTPRISKTHSNEKEISINGSAVDNKIRKIGSLATSSKGQVSKIEVQASKIKKNDHVVVNVGVRVARVNVTSALKNDKSELIEVRKLRRSSEETEDEKINKKARIEERKRKMEIENDGELTGLECFERLQSEEKINGLNLQESGEQEKDGHLSSCNENGSENGVVRDIINIAGGRPRNSTKTCDGCSRSLGKSFRTIKQSKCPKRFNYFFKQNKNRKSMKICKVCTKK